jgi:hypothetical protein
LKLRRSESFPQNFQAKASGARSRSKRENMTRSTTW